MSTNGKIAAAAAVTVGAAGAAYCAYQIFSKKTVTKLPEEWTEVGTLTEINAYPIKSCGRIVLHEAEITIMGLKKGWIRDRFLMIVDSEKNNFLTARSYPEMLLIQPEFHGSVLTLKHRDMEDVQVDLEEVLTHKKKLTATVWGVPVPVYECGWEVNEWISRLIKKTTHELRLVIYATNRSRTLRPSTNPMYPFTKNDTGALPDEVPYNLINQSSVDDLNSRLADKNVTTRNFRPSFVMKGPKPYDEDQWKFVKIGEHVFEIIKPCFRCVLTTIDPETGVRDSSSEPLKTLKTYRQLEDPRERKYAGESPRMGLQMSLRTAPGGKITLNDKIYVA